MDIIVWLVIFGITSYIIFYWKKRIATARQEADAMYVRMARLEELAYQDARDLERLTKDLVYYRNNLEELGTTLRERNERITYLEERISLYADDYAAAESVIINTHDIIHDNKLQGRAHFKDIHAFIEGYMEKDSE